MDGWDFAGGEPGCSMEVFKVFGDVSVPFERKNDEEGNGGWSQETAKESADDAQYF